MWFWIGLGVFLGVIKGLFVRDTPKKEGKIKRKGTYIFPIGYVDD